jgi:hypothetical protein
MMSSGTLYHVAVVSTDVLENVSPPPSGFLRVIGPHSYVTVEIPVDYSPHRGLLCKVEERCLRECFHAGNNDR